MKKYYISSKIILARNLIKEMDKYEISVRELARMSSVTPKTIAHIRRAEYDARLETIDKLARALGITSSALLTFDGNIEDELKRLGK